MQYAQERSTLDAEPLDELVLIRIRSNARTYWMLSDLALTRVYSPQVAEREAIARFEQESGRTHVRLVAHRRHHKPEQANALIEALRARTRAQASSGARCV
jgi:hypothetical protein